MLTVHCIIKNEENYIEYALRSIIKYVETVIVFDTGSTDTTTAIVRSLQKEFPQIILEEKGECDKKRHTELRQEMLERTTTSWFMILDGDEIWTQRGMDEGVALIKNQPELESIITPFYLCVGDIYHYSPRGRYLIRGIKRHATLRFFRKQPGMQWIGEYNRDSLCDANGVNFVDKDAIAEIKGKFWHVSHLTRSSKDANDYSSGSVRGQKRRLTYIGLGRKINEPVPEVFVKFPSAVSIPLPLSKSVINFGKLLLSKLHLL